MKLRHIPLVLAAGFLASSISCAATQTSWRKDPSAKEHSVQSFSRPVDSFLLSRG